MWRTAEEITNDLQSGNPERIAGGLKTLEFHMETLELVAIKPLTAELLAPFGTGIPEEVAILFHKLITRYEGFSPHLSLEDIEREAVLAAVRFGTSRVALEASLLLKSAEDPGIAVQKALTAVAERGLQLYEVRYASAFVSYLLAGITPVRTATVESLTIWHKRQDLKAVVDSVMAELDDDERMRILDNSY